MSLLNAIFGTASEVEAAKIQEEFTPFLADGEEVVAAFKIVRDLFVFTQGRLIFTDKQGLTGKKTSYHSIPYRAISQFAVETAGHFEMDSELKIWIAGNPEPIQKEIKAGGDIVRLQKVLASRVLAS